MLTYEALQQFCGKCGSKPPRQDYMQALVDGTDELHVAGITDNPLRLCHFLAQFAGHETGGMTIAREYTGWTPEQVKMITGKRFANLQPKVLLARKDPIKLANVVYGSHPTLGNTEPEDGYRFRGGGFSQLTGRDAYAEAGQAIGEDLENCPELIENPEVSLRVAIWLWEKDNLNRFADHNYGRTIGNAINRGNAFSKYDPIGYDSRARWFRWAWEVFGGSQPLPGPEAPLYLGAYGPKVKRIQGQLRELGYGVGDQDGVYGPTMARAVAGYKLDWRRDAGEVLEPEEMIGPLMEASLDQAQPIQLNPERESATIADLRARGSTEVAAGDKMEATGRVLATAGGLGLAEKTGVLDAATASFGTLTKLHTSAVSALKAVAWGIEHFWWIALIVGGIWCWNSGAKVKAQRLWAHITGMNLWR